MIPLKHSRLAAMPRLPGLSIAALLLKYRQLVLLLLAALVQGTIYLLLVPPWQHYDEPTHFEYAWLIADRGRLPERNDVDTVMRREVAASMIGHGFFRDSPPPDLLAEGYEIFIGISELGHPPAYYLLVSGPLRIARYLPIDTQLYVARSVSLLLFMVTIGLVWAAMRELTGAGNKLRWAVPLAVVLLPPFADLMTAVNNDVGATCVFTLFLWLSVRTIRLGLSWRRLILLAATALLAVATKNTASLALLLLPLVVLLALAAARRWSGRWLAALAGMALLLAVLAALDWGDPAFWYRDSSTNTQPAPARVATTRGPVGEHALMLETAPNQLRFLLSPLLRPEVERLAGSTVTVGAWIWSDRVGVEGRLSLLFSAFGTPNQELAGQSISTTTTPEFVTWSADIPRDAEQVLFALILEPASETAANPHRVMMDGAVIVEGSFANGLPVFQDRDAQTGEWNGQQFTNLLRNGSGEHAWPRLRPWLDAAVARYARRSPAQFVSALFDAPRTWPVMASVTLPEVLFGFFGVSGWGHITLTRAVWQPIFQGLALLATVGCVRWIVVAGRRAPPARKAQLVLLGIAGVLVWSNVVLRVLPLLDSVPVFAIARYGFPAIVPAALALCGGWLALWPSRWRIVALPALLSALTIVNAWSLWTIWSFYQIAIS